MDDVSDELSMEEFADGWALWEEHRPRTGEDWVGVAERCLADPGHDISKSHVLLQAAVLVVKQRNEARASLDEAHRALFECARRSGADVSDGAPTWPPLHEWAVQEVTRLREEYDECPAPEDLAEANRRLDEALEALREIAALALAYIGADCTDIADEISQEVWESLFERKLLRQASDQTGERYTVLTPEGELRLRSALSSVGVGQPEGETPDAV